MTDEKYMFLSDSMEKKRTARSAGNRVSGAKSKRCTLPSDFMTKKEQAAMSGEVKTYNLKQPMSWAEFKAMPGDLQKQYIENLIQGHHANSTARAEMFGVSAAHVRNVVRELGIHLPSGGANMMSKEAWAEWREFIGMPTETIPLAAAAPEPVEVEKRKPMETTPSAGAALDFTGVRKTLTKSEFMAFANLVYDLMPDTAYVAIKVQRVEA